MRREAGFERRDVCRLSRDEDVHAEIREIRGGRVPEGGGGEFREEFVEQTVRGRVQEELMYSIFHIPYSIFRKPRRGGLKFVQ